MSDNNNKLDNTDLIAIADCIGMVLQQAIRIGVGKPIQERLTIIKTKLDAMIIKPGIEERKPVQSEVYNLPLRKNA